MDLLPLQFTAPTLIRSTDLTRLVWSVTLDGHGRMERIKVTEAPLPKAVGDDHIEVEVRFCGLNFTDNYLRLGIIRNRNFPVIMGSECSGIVTAVGKDVTDLQVGQKVLCLQMQGGLFRHFVHVQRKYCFVLPDEISLKDTVGLGLHFVLAHFCLYEFGGLLESEKVFMHSVAGGVGTALIQLARAVNGVQVLGTASESKHDKLRSLGVKRVFRHEENYEEEILKDYPEGVDIVVNTIGGSEIEKCLKILRPVGKLVLLGSNSTATFPKSTTWGMIKPKWDCGTVLSADIISRNYCVAGVNIGLWMDLHPEAVQKALAQIFDLYSSGKLEPCIHAVLPFDEVADGVTQLCKRENFGKVILEVLQEAAEDGTSAAETAVSVDPQQEAAEKRREKAHTPEQEEKSAPSTPVDPQPAAAAEEPKEKVGAPELRKEESAASSEPKVVEESHAGEPEKVAEADTKVHTSM